MTRISKLLLSLGLTLWLAACGTLDRPTGPLRLADEALIPAQDPRILVGNPDDLRRFSREVGNRLEAENPTTVLALSGGGANGAYGAGVLVGWTESGQRPTFDIVTGVSTGALAAPFAFAGPEWDPQLQAAYTGGGTDTLLSWRSFAGFLYPSLFSNRVLKQLVDENLTPELLQAIAREHRRGRRLLVATTDLDSQQTVIWDLGMLAVQGDDNARELFKQVVLASASIPGVFPPVLIPGRREDGTVTLDMHVDGGVNTPFLAIPEPLLLWTRETSNRAPGALYIIVNGQAGRNEGVTEGKLTGILMRTYDSMSKASLRTLLAATAAFAERNGLSMKISAIPDNITASSVRFDQATMTALFNLGRRQGRGGEAWIEGTTNGRGQRPPTVNTVPLAEVPSVLRPEVADEETAKADPALQSPANSEPRR